MQRTCSEDLREDAVFCCACRFPMPCFCQECGRNHLGKPGFHFQLPLSALELITSDNLLEQYRYWFLQLTTAFARLERNISTVEECQERVEAAYKELSFSLESNKASCIQMLQQLKVALRMEIDRAIQLVRNHALDYSFIPDTLLNQLIWQYSPQVPESLNVFWYAVQAFPESLGHSCQVQFCTTVPELAHLNWEQGSRSLEQTIEQMSQQIQLLTTQLAETQSELETERAKSIELQNRLNQVQSSNAVIRREDAACINAGSELNIFEPVIEEEKQIQPKQSKKQPPVCVQLLIILHSNNLSCLDLATGKVKRTDLSKHIKVSDTSSSTLIRNNQIFVCGGRNEKACICYVDKSAYVLTESKVRELPKMLTAREAPGLIYDSDGDAVYVFGGEEEGRGNGYTVLRSCETFQSTQWFSLADMHSARKRFNPCWHSAVVYLCGGGTNSVETFDPQQYTFTIQVFLLPEETSCVAVEDGNGLVLITRSWISWLQHGRLTSQQHASYETWSACTPVVNEGIVYIAQPSEVNEYLKINLANGVKVK